MDTQTLRILQREVERQCRFGLLSIQLLDAANAAMHSSWTMQTSSASPDLDDPTAVGDMDEFFAEMKQRHEALREEQQTHTIQLWYAIQNFLIAAGNLSKLLWGTKSGADAKTWARRVQDRRKLRATLGVADNSVLKLSPEFRNHFEHMDERVEQWADRASHKVVSDLIGPTNAIGGLDADDFLRSYDPATQTLAFRGEVFDIVPVFEAMVRLLPAAAQEAAKPHWDSPSPSQPAHTAGGGE